METQNSKGVYRPAHGKPSVRKSGVVVPHTLNWPKRLAAACIYGIIRVVGASLRWRWEFHPDLEKVGRPVIFAIWHNRLALALLIYRGYVRQYGHPHKMAAIVSASKDGAVVARVLEHFGVQPVRGSTSRRGPQALLELTTWAEQNYDLAITPDGPRGPRYNVQLGAIALAQLTGLPIIPVSNKIGWKITTKSWDRFQIPLPFSRVVMRLGKPLYVPREVSDDQREELRMELEKRIIELTED
jgi:lysophospholipid acyltransferase (LPLAT)-like uncharacterized protein